MPELNEQMYCSQQIIIPPKYPYILKKYAKAAIKTQPLDLLRWSFLYFKSMEEGRCPPVKERLEFPPLDHDSGLTVGILKILANQLPDVDGYVKINIIKKNWAELSLCPVILQKMLVLAGAVQELAMPKLAFLAVATGFLTLSLTHTMILIFDVLSKEEEQPSLQLEDVLFIYNFLANIDASETKHYSSGLPMPQEKEFNGIEQTVKMLKRQRLDEASEDEDGVVAGRQLSSTSGEFIAQYVKDDIMGNVNAQIDILPDPNLKKKKAKPEEVEMVNEIVITVVDQIVEVVVSDEEASEEEIESIPDVLVIDPVPGISSIVHVHLQEAFVQKMTEAAIRQNNQILPRNIRCLALPIENDETQDSNNTKK